MKSNEEIADLVARHCLEVALDAARTASPYLIGKLSGLDARVMQAKEVENIQQMSVSILLLSTEVPGGWRQALQLMAGDFTSEEWAGKIGCSPAAVWRCCNELGVHPQGFLGEMTA